MLYKLYKSSLYQYKVCMQRCVCVESVACERSRARLMEVQTAVCWLMLCLAMSETLIYMHLQQRYLKRLCLIIQIKLPMLP